MAKDSYETPDWIMKYFKDWFDPCPLDPNPKIDGLKLDWPDKTYINPPYSKPRPWVTKAIEEAKKGKRIIMLLKADTSTKVFSDLMTAGARVAFIHGRVKFNVKGPATFPSMLVYL